MNSFTYEEQGEKKYLVYEKKTDDKMDHLTLEMMSNNRIDGSSRRITFRLTIDSI